VGSEMIRSIQLFVPLAFMSNVVEFLRAHGADGIKMLETQFAIHAARHKTTPSLVLFKYDQLNSPMSHPIVQECRGIVLDESRNWHIVVYPYQKFFNMREVANAAVIDWTNPVRAYEKVDGSLLTMYYSQGACPLISIRLGLIFNFSSDVPDLEITLDGGKCVFSNP